MSFCSSCGRPIIHALCLLGKVRLLVAWLKLLDALPAQTKDRSTVHHSAGHGDIPNMFQKCPKKSGYPATNWFAYSRSTFLDGATILLQKCERFPHVLVRKRWLFARHEFCLVQRHVHSVTRVIPIKSIAGIAGLRLKQLFLIIRAEFAALAADFEKACLCSSS